MNPENYTDPLLREIDYSTHPAAVAMRKRRAEDPALQQEDNAKRTKLYRAGRVQKLRTDAWRRLHQSPVKLERIKHHLSRGRDAGDIAVREGWLVSDVEKLIAQVA